MPFQYVDVGNAIAFRNANMFHLNNLQGIWKILKFDFNFRRNSKKKYKNFISKFYMLITLRLLEMQIYFIKYICDEFQIH